MVNYNDYIRKTLNEGLIKTYPISKHEDDVRLLFYSKSIKYVLNIDYDKEKANIEIESDYETVNSVFQTLGYFIYFYEVWRGNRNNFFKYTDDKDFKKNIENYTKLKLYYEARFDELVIPNDKIYHATNIKNIAKIDKVGLYPSRDSKIYYHTSRIYFSKHFDSTEKLIPRLKYYYNRYGSKDFLIYEIKTPKNIKFYDDPNLKDGIYTYSNIPKENLKLLKKIYTDDEIIEFDEYSSKLNKLKFIYNNELIYEVIDGKTTNKNDR